jgi:hypothetical protein
MKVMSLNWQMIMTFLFIFLMRYTFLEVAKAFSSSSTEKCFIKHLLLLFVVVLQKKYFGSQWVSHTF